MSIVLQSSGGGQITLLEPTTASNFTQTLPAATGTVMVSGNMPAFSAGNSGTQSLSAVTWTKLVFNSKEFDTNNSFDATTNYRFTPTIAGYYQIQAGVYFNIVANQTSIVGLYKNGILYKELQRSNSLSPTIAGSSLVYLNGTGDYVEIYGYAQTAITVGASNSNLFWFNGSMVRSA